ncbi:MAG: cupin domain-containing protein [Dehalococcoidia bacterium]|nr:cupin domain-containing protein [Dehalococcoidia bacterium]
MTTQNGQVVLPEEGKRLWFLGDLYVIKVPGEKSNGLFSVTEMTIAPAPGGGAPLHIHSKEDELFYVLDGALTYQVGEHILEASAGACLYVPRGVLHGFSNPRKDPVKALVFITPAGFEKFFEELGEAATTLSLPPPTYVPPDLEKVTALGMQYGTEVKGPPPTAS